jgi:hypothetical protein
MVLAKLSPGITLPYHTIIDFVVVVVVVAVIIII